MRRFGQFEEDLVVDFGRPSPFVATEVLGCCVSADPGGGPGQDFFWNLPVGKRIEFLLKATDWGNSGTIELNFVCQNPACKQTMEIALAVEDLTELQARTDGIDLVVFQHQGKHLSIRRPTGKDQLSWQAEGLDDERLAAMAMASRLLTADNAGDNPGMVELDESWVESAGQALQALDPLVDFGLDTACPHCGLENHFELDLEALCLGRLHQAQKALLETVHTLAKQYHWSEAQIFAVPAWRRAYYLNLIAQEADQ